MHGQVYFSGVVAQQQQSAQVKLHSAIASLRMSITGPNSLCPIAED